MPHAFIDARGSPWVAPWQLPHVVLADFLGSPVAVEPLARWLQVESHEPPPGLFGTCSESR